MSDNHYLNELLALIAEHQDIWARRAIVATRLQANMCALEATLRRLRIAQTARRRDSRDYIGSI